MKFMPSKAVTALHLISLVLLACVALAVPTHAIGDLDEMQYASNQ